MSRPSQRRLPDYCVPKPNHANYTCAHIVEEWLAQVVRGAKKCCR